MVMKQVNEGLVSLVTVALLTNPVVLIRLLSAHNLLD